MIPSQIDQTPLDRLHTLLDKVDDRISSLKTRTPDQALDVLLWLDEIDDLTTSLDEAGVDLRGEAGRLGAIQSNLQDKSPDVMLRLLKAKGGMAALRPANTPPVRWWWYLDEYVDRRRRRDLRNLAVTAIVIVAVVAVAALLYTTFVHPDPIVLARMDATNKAQLALQSDNLDSALAVIDAGLQKVPGDGELLLWRGAILTLMNRTTEAQAAWTTASSSFPDRATYLTERALVRSQSGDLAGSEADAREAITLAPDYVQAYLTLATAQELRGDYQGALASLQTAADLAAQQKNSQLEAMAKVRWATLLQNPPIQGMSPSPQPTK